MICFGTTLPGHTTFLPTALTEKANKALCAAVEKLIFRSDEVWNVPAARVSLTAAMAPKCKI